MEVIIFLLLVYFICNGIYHRARYEQSQALLDQARRVIEAQDKVIAEQDKIIDGVIWPTPSGPGDPVALPNNVVQFTQRRARQLPESMRLHHPDGVA